MLAKIKIIKDRIMFLSRKYPRRAWALGVGSFMLLSLYVFGYIPIPSAQSLVFQYSNSNCIKDLTLLPNIHRYPGNGGFVAEVSDPLTINGYPVISRKTCISTRFAPEENVTERIAVAPLNNPLLTKRYTIKTGNHPELNSEALNDTLSIREPLTFGLNQDDRIFNYKLVLGKLETSCRNIDRSVECGVDKLGLSQGVDYSLSLERYYNDQKIEEIINRKVTTVTPVEIVGGSVIKDQIIYSVPNELRITTDKTLTRVEVKLEKIESDRKIEVETTIRIEDKDILLILSEELPRSSRYEITLSRVIAKDKGELHGLTTIPFSMSGSPVVIGSNAGAYSLGQNQQFVLSFDQEVMAEQDFTKLVNLKAGGTMVPFTAVLQGSKLTIKPSVTLPFCSPIKIQVDNNLKSSFGVTGNSAWKLDSRTICHTIVTIGYSAKGRPITAWRFGTGASKIMYLGSIHGNEKGTKYLLDGWIKDLEANFHKIPSGRSIIVVPNLNPDGFASNNRKNANGVDLNRNFPANNWKADVTIPGGELVKNGGGSSALSEPEAKAIAGFITAEAPRLVLSYHSIASIVAGNDAKDANTLAAQYAASSRYRNMSGQATAVFNYDTTGALEDWLHDKLGIPCILIELGSDSDPQTTRNSKAMWSMAQIP